MKAGRWASKAMLSAVRLSSASSRRKTPWTDPTGAQQRTRTSRGESLLEAVKAYTEVSTLYIKALIHYK